MRDTTPPQVWLSVPRRVTTTTIPLIWGAADSQSGIAYYDLEIQIEGSAWQRVLTHTESTNYEFTALSGSYFTFRVIATDNVSNAESAEAASSLAVVRKYYYFGGQRVAMREVSAAAGDVVYYLHGDHLGSVSLATDAGGGLVFERRFLPYGDTRWQDGALPTDFGFGGQRHDGSTGLVFMHARYYLPGLARWTQADTIVPNPRNPQDLNRYSYVRNSPLNYTDPSGHQSCGFNILTGGSSCPGVNTLTIDYSPAAVSWPPPPPQLYWTAAPPRRVRSSEAVLQAQRDARIGSTILWGIGAIGAFGGTVAGASGGQQGGGYAGNMPPGQAVLGAGPVVPLDTAMFRLSREGEFTERYFKDNLAQIRPMPAGGSYDAHHMLAQAFETHPGVASALAEAGISIHDPRWGAWWERGPEGTHQKKWHEYNEKWDLWLGGKNDLLFDQLVLQAEVLAQEYGLDWSGDPFYYP